MFSPTTHLRCFQNMTWFANRLTKCLDRVFCGLVLDRVQNYQNHWRRHPQSPPCPPNDTPSLRSTATSSTHFLQKLLWCYHPRIPFWCSLVDSQGCGPMGLRAHVGQQTEIYFLSTQWEPSGDGSHGDGHGSFSCQFCGMSYCSMRALGAHIKITHTPIFLRG